MPNVSMVNFDTDYTLLHFDNFGGAEQQKIPHF